MPHVLPTFLIPGAMRSGTTSMARWLGAHPDVHMAPVKEVHYFDRNYAEGPDWYAGHFSNTTTERAIGEATPNYLYQPRALERIARDLPDVRMLVLLRDPVERAYSHYHHRRARNGEPLSFEAAIEREPERLRLGDDLARSHYSYLDRGRYLGQLHHLFTLVPRDHVLVQLFEDLRDYPAGAFMEAAAFVGVDPQTVPEVVGMRANRYQEFRSRKLRTLTQRLPGPAARLVGRLNRVESDGYPPMSAEARGRLAAAYLPERAELAALIDRDLGCWRG